jgi:HK97 family phage prohead protease
MSIERRALRPTEVRVDSANPRIFEADVLTYGIIDTYRTIFDHGVFDDSLAEHLPKITWGHEWTDPIGRYVDYKNIEARSENQPARLRLIGELDDFDAVPRAYQASAQLKSGTIDQFSVGFHRNEGGTYEDADGITHFRSAGLDEVALVLVGAVPGTKLVSVRSAKGGRREVPEEYVIDLAKKVAAGEITKEAAAIAVDLAAGVPNLEGAPAADGGSGPASAGVVGANADAGPPAEEIDAALGVLDSILG